MEAVSCPSSVVSCSSRFASIPFSGILSDFQLHRLKLGQVGGRSTTAVMKSIECRLGAALQRTTDNGQRTVVPWTHILADVAAHHIGANRRTKFFRDRPFQFNGE